VVRFDAAQPGRASARLASAVNGALVTGRRFRRLVKGYATVRRFASRGDHFDFDPDGTYSYGNIRVGHHVNLGAGPTLLATLSDIRIGNHVLFGPGVTVRGGNHRFDVVGRYTDTVTEAEKRPADDLGVVIEDDVWVGGSATILSGVTIGRGSIIGASAVVTTSVPPYSIVGGNPARVIRARFTEAEVAAHEMGLAQLAMDPDADVSADITTTPAT
jgi:acetyltransferase-like isoleucine patch superfamily enzyme